MFVWVSGTPSVECQSEPTKVVNDINSVTGTLTVCETWNHMVGERMMLYSRLMGVPWIPIITLC